MEKLYRLLYPMRIVLISASYNGKNNFMPAAWCFPLSFEPPIFGVAIAKKRHTYGLVHESREFVINIPGADLIEKIEKFGRTSGRDGDKFKEWNVIPEKSKKVGAFGIAECLVSLECRVVNEIEIGDHILFCGEAVNITKRREGKGIYQKEDRIIEL